MANFVRRKKKPGIELTDNTQINYQNLDLLREYVMESGRMVPSRMTGARAKYQRQLSKAIKQARFLALLPYCDTHD